MTNPELLTVFQLPFAEQETFFRDKLNIPTRRWDDLWKDQHAKGFMVAGACKADILTDFRTAVDKAITKGTTLEEFRKDFDDIVSRHGWSYNGSRNWRSEVIYSTNVRQSYNAGRWAQLTDPEQLEVLPYLTYKHGDSRNPRPHHLAWDGITLPADHPWWDAHYPQNGWGCKCRVYGSTKKEYEAAKAAGKGAAPKSGIDPKTGEPIGIDKGFGFNAGKAAQAEGYRVLTNKFETMPYDIAQRWMDEHLKSPAFERFFDGRINGDFPVAVLAPRDREVLGSGRQTVWLSSETMIKNKETHPDIKLEDFLFLPKIIGSGEVYRQGEERLIYLRAADKYYRASLKTTRDKAANFMLSLFGTTSEKAKRQVVEKYERIR